MKAIQEEKLEIESIAEWEKGKAEIDEMIKRHPTWTLKIVAQIKKSVSVSPEENETEETQRKFNERQLDIFTPAQQI